MAMSAGSEMLDQFWNVANYMESAHRSDQAHRVATHPISIKYADAIRAGVNPIFASGGASSSFSAMNPPASSRSQVASNIASMTQARASAKQANVAEKATNSQINLNLSKEESEKQLAKFYIEQADKAAQDTKTAAAMERKQDQEARAIFYDNLQRKKQKELYEGKAGKVLPWLDKIKEYLPFINK